jgi:hypothetical protein
MNKLPNTVLSFSDETRINSYSQIKEYFDCYKNGKTANSKGLSFAEMDKAVLSFFTKEIEEMSGRTIKSNMDLKQYCMFTDVKESAFAIVSIMTDLVLADTLFKDLGAIAEIKNGAWGDSLKVDMKPRDLFVVAKGGRARRTYDLTRQYKGEKTIVPEMHAISVDVALYDVLKGQYSLAEFLSKAVLSIETQMRYDIYDAFAAAMNALPSTAGAGQLKVSGYSQNSAIALAQKVEAWNGGNKAVFLGTRLALSNILPASTNTRILLGDEYVRVGYLRDFFGFSCVELEQIADYSTEFAVKLDDTKIYVLSPGVDKVVKVFVEGSTLSDAGNLYDHANLLEVGTLYKSYGVGVATTALVGEIDLA